MFSYVEHKPFRLVLDVGRLNFGGIIHGGRRRSPLVRRAVRLSATLGHADTVLFGRVTYDGFAGAWPERELAGEADAAMARALGDARKIVVSRQHLEFTWRNTEQLNGDLVEAVAALKQEPGEGTIGMSGSVSVVRQLLAAGLIVELHLLV